MPHSATCWKMTALVVGLCVASGGASAAQPPQPRVTFETTVYQYVPAGNGASPLWCSGSTCIVRTASGVYAAGLETIPDVKPLNNCRWTMFHLSDGKWNSLPHDEQGRTREPSPLATFHEGSVWLSANPTLTPENTYGGPARPELRLVTGPVGPVTAKVEYPKWDGNPAFTEHSYRSLAADGARGELILFQNTGYGQSEWAFRNSDGRWHRAGKLTWPWGANYEKPQPIRVCYPDVMLQDRHVYFCGVSDIVEPNSAWRAYKKELTGRDWDYDFRRLFFTWCDDISSQPFHEWVEIASREETCGWIQPADLWVDQQQRVHIMWLERALDERLRAKFFPAAKQSHSLNYAIVENGKVLQRHALLVVEEGSKGITPHFARFHVSKAGRLFVLCYVSGKDTSGHTIAENRIFELLAGGIITEPVTVPLAHPFVNFFTATVRAGSPRSDTIDILGQPAGQPNTIAYAQIALW